jgi:hypothetical protein
MAILLSFLGYLPLSFWRQGILGRDPDDPWWKFRLKSEPEDPAPRQAFYMIWCVKIIILVIACINTEKSISSYPLIYATLGLPLTGIRMKQFFDNNTPASHPFTLVSSFIFDLGGLCNVLLFIYTRKGLLLFPIWSTDNIEMQRNVAGVPPAE